MIRTLITIANTDGSRPTMRVIGQNIGHKPFLVLDLGEAISLRLPGVGPDAAQLARELADALVYGAQQIDRLVELGRTIEISAGYRGVA